MVVALATMNFADKRLNELNDIDTEVSAQYRKTVLKNRRRLYGTNWRFSSPLVEDDIVFKGVFFH
jgi:hypothetical protein